MAENEKVAEDNSKPDPGPIKKKRDPVRVWTLIVLLICFLLSVWYVMADRLTPYTSQARVNAKVVPIAPQVSGIITKVGVRNNQRVTEGQMLFQIDPRQYEIGLQVAQAQFEGARQAMASSAAAIDAARARVSQAEANLNRAKQDADRMHTIRKKDRGAISDRRLEMAEASLAAAEGAVTNAQAKLQQAIENFGSEGDQNTRILQAQAALDQAQDNLEHTTVKAPGNGLVTGVRLDKGNFAGTGAPQITYVATGSHWIQADFTENNLDLIRPGMKAEVVFDVKPGRVYKAEVQEVGYGVAVDTAPMGALPTISNDRDWLRDAQRFPVLVNLAAVPDELRERIKVGSQVSVVVYTGSHPVWNLLAWLYIRLVSLLTYAY